MNANAESNAIRTPTYSVGPPTCSRNESASLSVQTCLGPSSPPRATTIGSPQGRWAAKPSPLKSPRSGHTSAAGHRSPLLRQLQSAVPLVRYLLVGLIGCLRRGVLPSGLSRRGRSQPRGQHKRPTSLSTRKRYSRLWLAEWVRLDRGERTEWASGPQRPSGLGSVIRKKGEARGRGSRERVRGRRSRWSRSRGRCFR